MLTELKQRISKIGQPPGSATYTGQQKIAQPQLTIYNYTTKNISEIAADEMADFLSAKKTSGITWIDVQGLHDVGLIQHIANAYQLHPLTVEDILNVGQRPKVEEFADYCFITLKVLFWNPKMHNFTTEQLSIVFGKNFVLSFQEGKTKLFDGIRSRLASGPTQRLRQQGSDYLIYRLIDTVVDQYFVVLDGVGEHIEHIEERVIAAPTEQHSPTLYRLRRELLALRKILWPLREALSLLMQIEGDLISSFTRLYLRDVYDHTIQAMDVLESFRDMVTGILDIHLVSLTNRMNEIMKVLTIIATIFIPITFVASIYGMNFKYMPELNWRWGYPVTLGIMFFLALIMLFYFFRKKWLS